MSKASISAVAAAIAAFVAAGASAQEFYVSGALGAVDLSSSQNSGVFTAPFTTGVVTNVNPALEIDAGESLGWRTEFDSDLSFSAAFGYDYGSLRVELALGRHENDVDRHVGVTAAGIDLSTIDAGVLISGNTEDLGVTTFGLVNEGAGNIETTSLLLNAYYDFELGNDLTPYIGLGIGGFDSDVSFAPSQTPILDDSDSGFAWQLILGAEYQVTDTISFFGNFRRLDADDLGVDVDLLPATLNIENDLQFIELGLKYSFSW